jgi:hypothetical protein
MKMKRNKISTSMEHRLTKVEDATRTLYDDIKVLSKATDEKIDSVKDYVTNNLSVAISQTNKDLQVLLDRKQEHEAVKSFLSNALKLSCAIFGFVSSIATFLWAVTQVINFYRGR